MFSNAAVLSWREWMVTFVLVAVVLSGLPSIWSKFEPVTDIANFRIPYDLSTDYWFYQKWVDSAVRQRQALVVGDSFIWGEYVDANQTLSEQLNRAMGKESFANLGVNGLHPTAALGLLANYGNKISGKKVIYYFNPLWIQSPEIDLQGEKELRLQHIKLLPQFDGSLRCYKADHRQRIEAVMERNISCLSWIQHINKTYFGNKDLKTWVLEHPYQYPFNGSSSLRPMIAKSLKAHSTPETWDERGIEPSDYPWVSLETSVHWANLKKIVQLLECRGNNVYVLIGTFNPYLMTQASLSRYHKLRQAMDQDLTSKKIRHWVVPDQPSNYYTDASHVVREGYAAIGNKLINEFGFQEWLK